MNLIATLMLMQIVGKNEKKERKKCLEKRDERVVDELHVEEL